MSLRLQQDTLRLPAYRESIILRFHPYPQSRRRAARPDPLMTSVDYRDEEQPGATLSEGEHDIPHEEVVEAVPHQAEVPEIKRRRSLTVLIIDLALAVRNAGLLKKKRSASRLDIDG